MGAAAKRYARAIFELAEEEKKVDQWSQRLELVRQILANEQVRQVVRNPSIPTEERVAFVEKLDLPGLGAEGLNLLRLLVSNHRVDQADEAANGAKQAFSTEETTPERAPSKPLKKPKVATSQPFRRKAKRDKTGGPPQENEERDEP